jgi:hypothetical protein
MALRHSRTVTLLPRFLDGLVFRFSRGGEDRWKRKERADRRAGEFVVARGLRRGHLHDDLAMPDVDCIKYEYSGLNPHHEGNVSHLLMDQYKRSD